MLAGNHTPVDHNVLPWYMLTGAGLSSGLSILGCLVIAITYVTLPEVRNVTRTMLLFLTLADFLTAVGFFGGNLRYIVINRLETNRANGDDSVLCVLQSFVTTFSNMASYFWTVFIALFIFVSVVFQRDLSTQKCLHISCHVFAWGVPVAITSIAYQQGMLGGNTDSISSGSWCFIRGGKDQFQTTLWVLLGAAGWELLCYLTSCFLYMYTKYHLWRHRIQLSITPMADNLRREDRNFLFIWLVLYLLKMWGTIRFLWLTVSPSAYDNQAVANILDVLQCLQCFGSAGQGFANCFIFCFLDSSVRRGICRRCCRREEDDDLEPIAEPIQ